MIDIKTEHEKSVPPNLIVFPGGYQNTKADRLLIEFVDAILTPGRDKRLEKFNEVKHAIIDYVEKTNQARGGSYE